MKGRQAVQSIELSTIAHATEDLEKVETALASLLPASLRGRQFFNRRYLQGHYGNPIVTFEAHLTGPTDIAAFKDSFLKQLSAVEKITIIRDLGRYADKDGNLYIRIDKQRMYNGKVGLGQDDPIRVRIKFTRFTGTATPLMIEYLESE